MEVKNIKTILFDVDGVLTDGGIIYGTDGVEIKKFNVQDGMGITLAKAAGFLIGCITGRESETTDRRLRELGFDIIRQKFPQKKIAYNQIKEEYKLIDSQIAYVGDDIQDLPILKIVGLPIAVNNSVKEVKESAMYISDKDGGNGAVRDIVDMILEKKGIKEQCIKRVII